MTCYANNSYIGINIVHKIKAWSCIRDYKVFSQLLSGKCRSKRTISGWNILQRVCLSTLYLVVLRVFTYIHILLSWKYKTPPSFLGCTLLSPYHLGYWLGHLPFWKPKPCTRSLDIFVLMLPSCGGKNEIDTYTHIQTCIYLLFWDGIST